MIQNVSKAYEPYTPKGNKNFASGTWWHQDMSHLLEVTQSWSAGVFVHLKNLSHNLNTSSRSILFDDKIARVKIVDNHGPKLTVSNHTACPREKADPDEWFALL